MLFAGGMRRLPPVLFCLAVFCQGSISRGQTTAATPADQITVPAGFKVELLHSVNNQREGSWVSMAIDPKGRLYISPQNAAPDGGLLRVTVGAGGKLDKIEAVPVEKMSAAMGILWA